MLYGDTLHSWPWFCQMMTNFQYPFVGRLNTKFEINLSNVPPNLKRVTTLPYDNINVRKLAIVWNRQWL